MRRAIKVNAHATLAAAALALLGTQPAQAAVITSPSATLVKDANGEIVGVHNLGVNGAVFDVAFRQGSCDEVFGNAICGVDGTPFAQKSANAAVDVATALFKVLDANPYFPPSGGNAMSAFQHIADCSPVGGNNSPHCTIFVPYEVVGDPIVDGAIASAGGAWPGGGFDTTRSLDPNMIFAVVTEAIPSEVPEPPALGLGLAALAAAAGAARRRNRRG